MQNSLIYQQIRLQKITNYDMIFSNKYFKIQKGIT